MRYRIAGQSHVGAVRRSNQDELAWRTSANGEQALLVVADGMGGHEGGEIASRLAVESVLQAKTPAWAHEPAPVAADDARARLETAFAHAGAQIRAARAANPVLEKMGTTLVVVWLVRDTAFVAHVGDSRCYRVRDGAVACLTRDDTVVQNMLEDGTITEADVPNVPFRHVLTRAIGAGEDTCPSFREERLMPGDGLLLCSDGLTGAVPVADWPGLLQAADNPDQAVQSFINQSLSNGAEDNVSVLLLTLEY